jgi:SAM-dependent methyltransferase
LAGRGPFDELTLEYDSWFDEHSTTFTAELEAVRAVLPEYSHAVEIGVGTGRFAGPLGITLGVEPSEAMGSVARGRGIEVIEGVAEDLPCRDAAFDLVLMVTLVCFLDDVDRGLGEAHRVLVGGGHIVVGFLDRETELGRTYEARKTENVFYRQARFRSSAEVIAALTRAGFGDLNAVQTIFDPPDESRQVTPPVRTGYGEGLFVAVCGQKGRF